MRRVRDLVPTNLQHQLEEARLDLLALFRALYQLDLGASEIPQGFLRQLSQLDADLAEALHVLDWPARSFDVRAMLADTRASLRRVAPTRERFLAELVPRALQPLSHWTASIRPRLSRNDAYHSIPGRDPQNG